MAVGAVVVGGRQLATVGRLVVLWCGVGVVGWMTDGWALYESRLK